MIPSLAQSASYQFQHLFIQPLPLWDDHLWPWLLVPLCAAVAIVYKSIRCRSMKTVPREASVIFLWILVCMVVAGAALSGIVRILETRG